MKKEKSFSYEKFRSSYSLNCPDNFNFALDIISNKYGKSEKTALIAINNNGNDFEKVSYKDLDENSSRFANALKNLGIKKKDKILIILPKISEWYYCILGCGKVGAIAIPSTPMLKANDIEYRIQKSESKAIISTSMNVEEIEKIKNCQTLEHKIIVHDKIDNWYSFEEICNQICILIEI